MTDEAPQVEVKETSGSTSSFVSTVGTSPISIPSVAGNHLTEFMIHCPTQPPVTVTLQFSIDGGTNYHTLSPGESILWPLKGTLQQIMLKGSTAGVKYEAILNFSVAGEPP